MPTRAEEVISDLWWLDSGGDAQGYFLNVGHHSPIIAASWSLARSTTVMQRLGHFSSTILIGATVPTVIKRTFRMRWMWPGAPRGC